MSQTSAPIGSDAAAVSTQLQKNPLWETISVLFDATQFSLLFSFEEALRSLVGAVYKLRPDSTMNAAIILLGAPGGIGVSSIQYVYRWYTMEPTAVHSVKQHIRLPMLFGDTDPSTDADKAIKAGQPFAFDQPVTLASAFLYHELQRNGRTRTLLENPETCRRLESTTPAKFWKTLDEDKFTAEEEQHTTVYTLRNPGERYNGLHRETIQAYNHPAGTSATFVKPLIVGKTLFGLYCVDISEKRGPDVTSPIALTG